MFTQNCIIYILIHINTSPNDTFCSYLIGCLCIRNTNNRTQTYIHGLWFAPPPSPLPQNKHNDCKTNNTDFMAIEQ